MIVANRRFALLFISTFIFFQFIQAEHFNVSIDPTGESTLFIFQDSISSLDNNDEIGLFDANGILDAEGSIGEILVGSGVWDGTQTEIVGIMSVDLSDFNGPILPGAISGNSLILKIWDDSEQREYNVESYNVSVGTGTFDNLFRSID